MVFLLQLDHIRLLLAVQFARNLKRPDNNPFSWYITQTFFKRCNVPLEAAAVDACELRPGQNVLEIGFGPGYGILFAAERVAPLTLDYLRKQGPLLRVADRIWQPDIHFTEDGHVSGVDISNYMLKLASRRCRKLMPFGIVDLSLNSVDHLPQLASTMDACFHVNCFYYWHNMDYALRNIWRVLRPNGRLVTCFQPDRLKQDYERGWLRYGRGDPVAYALALEACGFNRIEWLKKPLSTGSVVPSECIVARKPPIELISHQLDTAECKS
ncbi:hypothetical protein CRM22_004990 [Opisthorchis felineus]|uniref:Methyltransferase type 11 domain-containing protein n=1 Tax=Opisthorchis felineus TaxID=147828 RepID=A0A4S2LTE1_OPIFE|nr:hypothetical protein CRM22_004990 [Opisthorchis felineus]